MPNLTEYERNLLIDAIVARIHELRWLSNCQLAREQAHFANELYANELSLEELRAKLEPTLEAAE